MFFLGFFKEVAMFPGIKMLMCVIVIIPPYGYCSGSLLQRLIIFSNTLIRGRGALPAIKHQMRSLLERRKQAGAELCQAQTSLG